MMLRYVLLIGLLITTGACISPVAQSQTTAAQEIHEDELAHEEEHNDEEEVEHEHEEEHNDEEENEHEHEEEHNDEHDDNHEADEDYREHEAHEHGAAELMIAWSGNDLAIDLQTPAYNVLGFEYAPTTDAEQALLNESVADLESGELLQFSPDANCTLISVAVKTELAEEAHEEEVETHEAEEETHTDIDVSYNIQCQQPDKLESLDLSKLFTQFPNFEALRAQWVSDVEQSAKSLTSDDPILSFK